MAQIEIYFSVVQRKVLAPNDFTDLAEVETRLLNFQDHYEQIAQPFEWKFTSADLDALCSPSSSGSLLLRLQPRQHDPKIRHRNSVPEH